MIGEAGVRRARICVPKLPQAKAGSGERGVWEGLFGHCAFQLLVGTKCS